MAKVTAAGWGAEGTNALEEDYFEKQEEKWAGSSSSPSNVKPENEPKSGRPAAPKRARTTARRSKKAQEASGIADSVVSSTDVETGNE